MTALDKHLCRCGSHTRILKAVERAKRYIFDGDIMQVVLSQRMSQPFPASALTLYRSLRALNPSPYMFFYNFGDFHVVGASPEILVRLENGKVTVRPIAGTRPRGATPEADRANEAELLADPKERAEHVMLIDLARNDIGRIAQTGTVKVTEAFGIERYSHVMHIVSHVEGRLKPGLDAMAVLKATFPAGTLSGAPKIRAVKKEQKLYLWDWSELSDVGIRWENFVGSQLLKFCHFIEDTQGYKMELRYLRDFDGREVDFVVLKERKPLF